MCQSKAQGGKRCEHAESYNNAKKRIVRKLAKEKSHLGVYGYDIVKALNKFLEDNPDVAYARLPKRETFNCKPASKRPIPKDIAAILNRSRGQAITGHSEFERLAVTQQLNEEYMRYADEIWDPRSEAAVHQYSMAGYLSINSYLRGRRYYKQWAYMDNIETYDKYAEGYVIPKIADLDRAFEDVPKDAPIRKTYRLFEVPPGIKPEDYIEQYMKTGEGFHEKGFMSTSADPEFTMMSAMQKNGFRKNKKYIIIEVVSNRGISLQSAQRESRGNIQSLEKEILLPRDSKFRIAGVKKSQKFRLADKRPDLMFPSRRSNRQFVEGLEYNLPLVQLVDETVI